MLVAYYGTLTGFIGLVGATWVILGGKTGFKTGGVTG